MLWAEMWAVPHSRVKDAPPIWAARPCSFRGWCPLPLVREGHLAGICWPPLWRRLHHSRDSPGLWIRPCPHRTRKPEPTEGCGLGTNYTDAGCSMQPKHARTYCCHALIQTACHVGIAGLRDLLATLNQACYTANSSAGRDGTLQYGGDGLESCSSAHRSEHLMLVEGPVLLPPAWAALAQADWSFCYAAQAQALQVLGKALSPAAGRSGVAGHHGRKQGLALALLEPREQQGQPCKEGHDLQQSMCHIMSATAGPDSIQKLGRCYACKNAAGADMATCNALSCKRHRTQQRRITPHRSRHSEHLHGTCAPSQTWMQCRLASWTWQQTQVGNSGLVAHSPAAVQAHDCC